jgi:hypothetical protein
MATHGVKTGVKWNAIDISPYLDKSSLDRLMDLVETTAFGNSAKSRVAGLPDGKVAVSGPYDAAIESAAGMETDYINGTARALKIQVDRTATASATNPAYTLTMLISDLKMDSSVSSKWGWSASLELASGTIARSIAGAF